MEDEQVYYSSYIGVPSHYQGEALLAMLTESLSYMQGNTPGPITHLDICIKKPSATTRAAIAAWALLNDVEIAFYPKREANRRMKLDAAEIRAARASKGS